jgi:hypothetical protein
VQFFRPPYVGNKGWVGVRIDGRPDWKVVAGVVRDAHDLITSSQTRRRSLPLHRYTNRRAGSVRIEGLFALSCAAPNSSQQRDPKGNFVPHGIP